MVVEYLKDSYKPQLWTAVAFNVLAFWAVIVSHADFSTFVAWLEGVSIKDGLIGSVAPTLAFLLDGLLSPGAKARVVYWRWQHALPGSGAFTVHLYKEPRVDAKRVEQSWGPLPDDPCDQNRLWYRIYESFNTDTRVVEAHRAWLFSRDLTALTCLFLVLFGTAALFSDASWTVCGWYLGALMVQYLVTSIAARNQGIRLVRQVLVNASQTREDCG